VDLNSCPSSPCRCRPQRKKRANNSFAQGHHRAQGTLGIRKLTTALTAAVVEFIEPARWFVAGRALAADGPRSCQWYVSITDEANTKAEKARCACAVHVDDLRARHLWALNVGVEASIRAFQPPASGTHARFGQWLSIASGIFVAGGAPRRAFSLPARNIETARRRGLTSASSAP
jgi:hypothetical protein